MFAWKKSIHRSHSIGLRQRFFSYTFLRATNMEWLQDDKKNKRQTKNQIFFLCLKISGNFIHFHGIHVNLNSQIDGAEKSKKLLRCFLVYFNCPFVVFFQRDYTHSSPERPECYLKFHFAWKNVKQHKKVYINRIQECIGVGLVERSLTTRILLLLTDFCLSSCLLYCVALPIFFFSIFWASFGFCSLSFFAWSVSAIAWNGQRPCADKTP